MHPLGDETTTLRDPNSLFNASLSCFTPPNTIMDSRFVPSALALRQTDSLSF